MLAKVGFHIISVEQDEKEQLLIVVLFEDCDSAARRGEIDKAVSALSH